MYVETDVMTDKEKPKSTGATGSEYTIHINFLEAEEADDIDTNNSTDKDGGDDSATKKEWEQLRKDQKNKQASKDWKMEYIQFSQCTLIKKGLIKGVFYKLIVYSL